MNPLLQKIQADHASAVSGFLADCGEALEALALTCAEKLKVGGKLIFCGNGGSACDAMHIAGEFVGRFVDDRPALAAIALSADSGIMTAVANDYDYSYIFARQIEALGRPDDVLIALSTSGKSANILRACAAATAKGLYTVLLTGEKGRSHTATVDATLVVPSLMTAHVQEAHMVGLHALATLIEAKLFPGS